MVTPIEQLGSAYAAAKKIQEGAKAGWNLWKWYRSVRYPRPRSGEIGIVIGIDCEGESVFNQVHNDLIRALDKLVTSGNTTRPFKILPLPLYHQQKLKNQNDAEKVLKKCGAKLIIWGQAKARNIAKKEHIVLEIQPIASHGEIVLPISEVFAKEMSELLPARLLVSKDNNLVEMELNALGMTFAAHYIIATACFLSEDKEYSKELFQTLKRKLSEVNTSALPEALARHIVLLRKKVDLNIVTILLERSRAEHRRWRKTRNTKELQTSYEHALEAEAIIPGLYQTALAQSIYAFVVEEDARKSLKILGKWASTEDGTWAFNMAFLHAYEGNLVQASKYYKIALRRSTNSEVMLEIEEFLEWILARHPEKYQLHYCLGMMQFFVRRELSLGREHFEQFLAAAPAGQFVSQIYDVKKYLDPDFKITKKLGN